MTTPESIEIAAPSYALNLAKTLDAYDFTHARKMTVSYGQRGPLLRLQGDWFAESGFPIGTPATVYAARDLLVVHAERDADSPQTRVHEAIR